MIPVRSKINNFSDCLSSLQVLLLIAISMVMLVFVQAPYDAQFFIPVVLVPFIIAVLCAKHKKTMLGSVYIFSVIYFLYAFQWLWPVTGPGVIVLSFYMALYFLGSAIIIRHCFFKGIVSLPLLISLVWVVQEFLRGYVFTGLPWLFLAHGLHHQITFIQISDIFGAYGVTFVIAMVNGAIAQSVLHKYFSKVKPLSQKIMVRYLWVSVVLIIGSYSYGLFRIAQGDQTITQGPIVSAIQGDIPQSVKDSSVSGAQIMGQYFALSKKAMDAKIKPHLMVWPETITPPINRALLDYKPSVGASPLKTYIAENPYLIDNALWVNKMLSELASTGTHLLVGGSHESFVEGVDPQGDTTLTVIKKNSAYYYTNDGKRSLSSYDKNHLVLFGEYVPFKQTAPFANKILNSLTPYDYDYSLTPGDTLTVFALNDSPYHFAVAICYEDVIEDMPRKLVQVTAGKKRVDFLLNISNEGWYVTEGEDGNYLSSAELLQHLAICQFRSIENRVAFVRSVNMGISAFIRPDGAVQHQPLCGTLKDHPRDRQAVAGFITDYVYIDSRVSIYSQIGNAFVYSVMGWLVILLVQSFRVKNNDQIN